MDIVTAAAHRFHGLPNEMKAEVFRKFERKERQRFRSVCNSWRSIIDTYFGIHIEASNLNWDWVEGSNHVISAKVIGLTRDIYSPCQIASQLEKLELTDLTAYYSLFHLLQECINLRTLSLGSISFLPRSKLPEFMKPDYFEQRPEFKWLPRLKTFKFSTHTPLVVADEVEQMDLGRRRLDEAEIIPMIFRLLQNTPLENLEMTLGDMWIVEFKELFGRLSEVLPLNSLDQDNAGQQENPNDVFPMHLYRSMRLPLSSLIKARDTLINCEIYFPFRDDKFSLKFYRKRDMHYVNDIPIPQLKEVSVHQCFKWASEVGEKMDSKWLEIFEYQTHIKKFQYSFPITRNDDRMIRILNRNKETLEKIVFVGYRQTEEVGNNPIMHRQPIPWDCSWFTQCLSLKKLTFAPLSRILFPLNYLALNSPQQLPNSLQTLNIIGTVNTGNVKIEDGLKHLTSLEKLEIRVRNYPWFITQGRNYREFDLYLFHKIVNALPKLRVLKLLWSEELVPNAMVGFLMNNNTNPDGPAEGEVSSKTEVTSGLVSWLKGTQYIEFWELRTIASSFHLRDFGYEIKILPGFNRNFAFP